MRLDKMFAVGETFFVVRPDSSIEDLVIDQHVVAAVITGGYPSDAKLVNAAGKSFAVWHSHALRKEAEAERATWIIKEQAAIHSRHRQLQKLIAKLTERGEWPFVCPTIVEDE